MDDLWDLIACWQRAARSVLPQLWQHLRKDSANGILVLAWLHQHVKLLCAMFDWHQTAAELMVCGYCQLQTW